MNEGSRIEKEMLNDFRIRLGEGNGARKQIKNVCAYDSYKK